MDKLADSITDRPSVLDMVRNTSRTLFNAINAAEELNSKFRGARPTEAGKMPTPTNLMQWVDQIYAQSECLLTLLSEHHIVIGNPNADQVQGGTAAVPGYGRG